MVSTQQDGPEQPQTEEQIGNAQPWMRLEQAWKLNGRYEYWTEARKLCTNKTDMRDFRDLRLEDCETLDCTQTPNW